MKEEMTFKRQLRVAALALPMVLMAAGCGSAESEPTTARVAMGSVSHTVAATGTLQAISEQKLGFAKGGKLTQLMVSVGQQVQAGQVLAMIDDLDAKADLQQATAKLNAEQARLDKLNDSNRVDAADEDHDRANDILDATKDERDEIGNANDEYVKQLREQLADDREGLRNARAQLRSDQSRCNRSLTGNSHRYGGYGDYTDVTSKGDKGLLLENPLNLHSPSCERAERGKQAVTSYERRLRYGQNQLSQAQRRGNVDSARQRVAVANAKRDAAAAKNEAEERAADLPHEIAEQEAAVSDAEAVVRKAQRDVDDTVLRAPVSGRVASINGTVGEFLGGASGTTPLAPGGRVALPDVESGAGAKDSEGNKATRPGGNSFMTLKDVNSYQVVAPYEESDAAQIQPGQKVNVSFDAVPGLNRTGTVSSIAPVGTQIKDVTNYYVSVVLNDLDDRLRGGLTAETKIIVGGLDNVLVVPSAAVQRAGNTGVVQVMQADGTTKQVQVELGLVGDTTTQILSGLTLGQRVVIAQN